MLLNDFFTIETVQRSEAPVTVETHAVLVLNAAHPIFAGHFPGEPVVPGACQLQMLQETLSYVTGSEYILLRADQLKFLTPIDPRQHPRIGMTLRYPAPHPPMDQTTQRLPVTAVLSAVSGELIFLKFTGTFRAE